MASRTHPSNDQTCLKLSLFDDKNNVFRLGRCWAQSTFKDPVQGLHTLGFVVASGSLHILVPNFLKKCTQFTKSLNWFQASNLLVYWFQGYGFTYPTLQMTKTCLKRSLFDGKNNVFWMVLGFRNSGCCELGLRLSSIWIWTNWFLTLWRPPWKPPPLLINWDQTQKASKRC